MDNKREMEVEALKTPKGANVPTLKGLQAVVDGIYEDLSPLESSLASLHASSKSISSQVEDISTRLESIQQFLSDFLLMIGRIDASLANLDQRVQTLHEMQQGLQISDMDILEVRDSLADLLAQSKFSDLLEEVQSASRLNNKQKGRLNVQQKD